MKKVKYFEYLRSIATIAVVFLHVCMTLPANYSKDELGLFNYAFFECGYMLVCWAVPIFIMITGALLLNPEKKITFAKVKQYIKRMGIVLILFGSVYALMELVFSEKTFVLGMIPKALFNVIEEKSWDHLWYLYVLIGLYILTIPLSAVVKNIDERVQEILLILMIVGCFLIPTINTVTGRDIANFMLIEDAAVYYVLGHYLASTDRKFGILPFLILPVSIFSLFAIEICGVYFFDPLVDVGMMGNSVFRIMAAASLFLIVRKMSSRGDRRRFCSL